MELSGDIAKRGTRIRLLLMDCDGVLTDGRLYFSDKGEALKVFHVRDGQGLATWHAAGYESGIISGRGAREIIDRRAEELGIKYVYTGSNDKRKDFAEIVELSGLASDEVAYIGDDVGDIHLFGMVGLAVAVADAVAEAKAASHFVTSANGGAGAVREVIDLLLKLRPANP